MVLIVVVVVVVVVVVSSTLQNVFRCENSCGCCSVTRQKTSEIRLQNATTTVLIFAVRTAHKRDDIRITDQVQIRHYCVVYA